MLALLSVHVNLSAELFAGTVFAFKKHHDFDEKIKKPIGILDVLGLSRSHAQQHQSRKAKAGSCMMSDTIPSFHLSTSSKVETKYSLEVSDGLVVTTTTRSVLACNFATSKQHSF